MKHTGLLVSFLVAAAGIPALGESININFGLNIDSPIDSVYWNNTGETASGTVSNLVDDSNNSTSASVSFSSNTKWSSGISGVYNGYLDDGGSGVSIAVSGISYLLYDVTVYTSSDFADSFHPMTVNGVSYTDGGSGIGIEGTDSWSGTAGDGTKMYGSLSVKSQSGALTVSSGIRADKLRGCIAGISVTNAYAGTTTSATLNGSGFTWANGSTFGTGTWTNSTDKAGTYAAFTISNNTAVIVDATSGVTTDAITLTGSGTMTLSGGTVDLIGPGIVRTDSNTASISVGNTLNFSNGGVVSGNVSTTGSGVLNVSAGRLNVSEATDASALTISLGSAAATVTGFAGTAAETTELTNVTGTGTIEFSAAGSTDMSSNDFSYVALSEQFTGTLALVGGSTDVRSGGSTSLGGASKILLNGGGLLFQRESGTFAHDIELGESGGAVRLYGANSGVTLSGNLSGTGTLTHTDGGVLIINPGEGKTVNIGGLNQAASTNYGSVVASTEIHGNATIGVATVSGGLLKFAEGSAATVGTIAVTSENSSLTVSGNVTTEHLWGTANGYGANTMGITETGVLNITGTVTNGRDDPARTDAAFALSHWGSKVDFTVAGVLNVANAGISNVDGAESTLTVSSTGEANFGKGLFASTKQGALTVVLDGGTLNVGASTECDGINTAYTSRWDAAATDFTLTLKSGTIGSLSSSWSSTSALTLDGAITIDTTTKQISTTGKATEVAGSNGSSVTLFGVISGEGKLNKTGAGTLTLSGENTYAGGTTVSAGTLVANNASALGAGEVTLETGGVLQVGDGVTLSSNVTILVSGSDYYVNDAALTGNGTFAGTVTLDGTLASAIALASVDARSTPDTLTYKIFGEGLSHDSVTVQLSETLAEEMAAAGWTMTTNADGTVSFAAIPEPSAFGLLAGLGALALVASRRRRAKRA